MRLYVADRKLAVSSSSFLRFVDLLAILPFYVSTGVDTTSSCHPGYFRLFRGAQSRPGTIAPIWRFFHAGVCFNREEEIILFGLVAIFILFLSAVVFTSFENEAQPECFSLVFHSFWWSVCTRATVGVRRCLSVTTGGKVFTFFCPARGSRAIISGFPAGLVASGTFKSNVKWKAMNQNAGTEQSRLPSQMTS